MSALEPKPSAEPRTAALHVGIACLMIAFGGLLIGLQVDGTGAVVGTGYAGLSVGAVVALAALLLQASRASSLPRDLVSGLSAMCAFCGVAFIVSGVLAPGGAWMFFEVVLLVVLLSRRSRKENAPGPDIRASTIAVLVAMLLFRLWITYQGSEHRWQVLSIPIPILSWLPFDFLDPVKTISLGEFEPEELGFPRTGIDFPATVALWSIAFALCAAGLLWRSRASVEHENDRIHDTIQELPPQVARAVETLLPEEQWEELGLHGLSDRMLRKRISALVAERMRRRGEVESALRSADLLSRGDAGGFAGEIQAALASERLARSQPAAPDRVPRLSP